MSTRAFSYKRYRKETKMAENERVKIIVDKKTGKRYTFTMTGGDHYEYQGSRGTFSLDKEYFGRPPFTEKSLIKIAQLYD